MLTDTTSAHLKTTIFVYLRSVEYVDTFISSQFVDLQRPPSPLSYHLPTMVLTLYGGAKSTCTRRVAAVAKLAGVNFKFVQIDYAKGEHKSSAYLEKQPFGQIPYIVSFPSDVRLDFIGYHLTVNPGRRWLCAL